MMKKIEEQKISKDQREEITASVSDAEIEILQELWIDSPQTAQSIIKSLEQKNSAHPSTVKTLINRLLTKNALGFHEHGRKYHYFPKIAKSDFYHMKTSSFLDKFFDGEISPLVSFFSSRKKLSEKEIEELKSLVEKLEQDNEN